MANPSVLPVPAVRDHDGVSERAAARPAGAVSKAANPYTQFEAFVLQSFIQSMLPSDGSQIYGEGTAGQVWKSMLAEKMAQELSERGGIGIAKMIAPKGDVAAVGVDAAASRGLAAGRVAEWQMTSALEGTGGGGVASGTPARKT